MAHSAPPMVRPTSEPEVMSAMSRAMVQATFDEDAWRQVLETHDPVTVVNILKRVLADIGDQEQRRINGLATARVDEFIDDDTYAKIKRDFHLWKRSIAEVRQRLRRRIAEVQPVAQSLRDSHQADRRSLVILAKRIWLWENGLDDRLDYALDDCTISESGEPTMERKTLRELMREIAQQGEVTP